MHSHNARWNVETDRLEPIPRVLIISDETGFGLALARQLLERDTQVFYFENQENNQPKFKSEIHELQQSGKFEIVSRKLPQNFDYLFHLNCGPIVKQVYSTSKLLDLVVTAQAKYLCATSHRTTLTRAHLCSLDRGRKINWRLIHFNYVWGVKGNTNTPLGLLTSEINSEKLIVSGNGEEKIYPLYIEDFVQGLLRAMFLKDSFQRLYLLSGIEPMKMTDFCWHLKNTFGKELKIEYTKAPEIAPWPIDHFAFEKIKNSWWYLGFYPAKNSENLKLYFKSLQVVSKKNRVSLIKKISRFPQIFPKFNLPSLKPAISQKKAKDAFGSKFLVNSLIIITTFLILLLPYLICLGVGWRGVQRLNLISRKLKNKQLDNLTSEVTKAHADLALSQNILYKLAKFNNLIGLGPSTTEANKLLNLGLGLTASLENLENSFNHTKNLEEIIFARSNAPAASELATLQFELGQMAQELAFLQTQIDDLGKTSLPLGQGLNENLKLAKETIPQARKEILQTRQFLSLLPAFLAFEGKKSYLVLLQNNMELRATGGYIGSFAILTFEKGRLLDFLVEDVWNADGQLQGHVTPPPDLESLGFPSWYLRDSNWSPDFPTSAFKASWFLEKETGRAADGVMAINLNVIKSILSQIGPVQVPGYGETITADNLFQRTEYQAEANFFPGSSQKKSFLSALSVFLFEKIKELPPDKIFNLFQLMQKNLDEKDMFFYFNDPALNQKIREFGWSGEIKKINLGKTANFSGPGLADYLMLVDSNVGMNKANFFIKRQVELSKTIASNGRLTSQLKLVYKNTSTSEAWPGGTYKNYLRLLLPLDVDKISVKESVGGGQPKPIIEKIKKSTGFEKNIFGFLTSVGPGETKEILVSYEHGQVLPIEGSKFDLAIYLQKQSGIPPDPVNLKINFPVNLKPVKIMPQGLWKPQNVTFSTELTQDKLFAVEFAR